MMFLTMNLQRFCKTDFSNCLYQVTFHLLLHLCQKACSAEFPQLMPFLSSCVLLWSPKLSGDDLRLTKLSRSDLGAEETYFLGRSSTAMGVYTRKSFEALSEECSLYSLGCETLCNMRLFFFLLLKSKGRFLDSV